MSRRSIIVLIAVLVVALGVMGYRRLASGRPTANEDLQTTAVERGNIVATVNATGSIAPKVRAALAFRSAGRVAEILVEEGERVEAGQILARLETDDLELAVTQAEATLTMSKTQLEQTKKGARAQDLAAAEASLASAQASLAKLLAGANEREIEMAKLNWDQAKNSLWAAQLERDSIAGNKMSSDSVVDAANARVAAAETAVEIARLQYEQTKAEPTEYDIATAQAQVDQARATLDKLKAGATTEELAVAQAQVDQARAALAQARLGLEQAAIVAPFAGTVARVGAELGELVSSATPMIVLVDLSGYNIDANIDEIDISQIAVGQDVAITIDAFLGEELSGQVTRIDPIGTLTQGVVSYGVTIEITPNNIPLKPDMTANVDIVVGKKEGVLLVPNRAIRRDQGGKYVEVIVGGQTQQVYITTGLSNEAVIEVLDGLEEGVEVVVSAPRRNIFEGSGGFIIRSPE